MQRTVVLLRHAQTAWNVEGRFNSTVDLGLTEFGAEQAASAASPLARLDPFTFVRSDALRAGETAAPLGDAVGREPVVDPRLAEVDFGPFEGRAPSEVSSDPEFLAWNDGGETTDAGPEALEAAADRAHAGLMAALDHDDTAARVVIVSHGALLRVLLCRAVLDLPARAYRRLVLDNARAAVVRFDAGAAHPRLLAMNVSPEDVPDLPDA